MQTYVVAMTRTERYMAIISLEDGVEPDQLTQRERQSIIDGGTNVESRGTTIEIGNVEAVQR